MSKRVGWGLASCLMACSATETPVEILEPEPGSVHGAGPVAVVTRPAGAGPLFLDGHPLAAPTVAVPQLEDGRHRLEVRDRNGRTRADAYFWIDRTAPEVGIPKPLVARPSRATLDVAVRATDVHRVRTVEAQGVPLARGEGAIYCGNTDPSELPPGDDEIWHARLVVGDAGSVQIVARDVMGHVTRIDAPVLHSMVQFVARAPVDAAVDAQVTGGSGRVLSLRGPSEVLALDANDGQVKARFEGEAADAIWADEEGLVVRRRLPDGRHVLQAADADAPWDLPGDVLAAVAVAGRVVAVGVDSGGTLAVSASRALSRFCPDDGRPAFDEPLPFITRLDEIIPVPDGLLLLGTAFPSHEWRLVMLRP